MILAVSGPYDGRKIRSKHIIKHTVVLVLKSSRGTRRFINLPDPAD